MYNVIYSCHVVCLLAGYMRTQSCVNCANILCAFICFEVIFFCVCGEKSETTLNPLTSNLFLELYVTARKYCCKHDIN